MRYTKTQTEKNSVEEDRTVGAIAMKRSGNLQGGYRFLNLKTGRVLTRHHFTVSPITSQVIDRVEELARKQGVITDEEEFLHGDSSPVGDEEREDEDNKSEVENFISNEDIPELVAEEEQGTLKEDDSVEEANYDLIPDAGITGLDPPVIDLTGDTTEQYQPLSPEPVVVKEEENEIVFEEGGTGKGAGLFDKPFMREKVQEPEGRYTRRTGRTIHPVPTYIPSIGTAKKYPEVSGCMVPGPGITDTDKVTSVLFSEEVTPKERITYDESMSVVLGEIFQQMHINKGIKRFGTRAEDAGKKEMRQIHDRSAVNPLMWDILNPKERDEVIYSLLLIEEKRNLDVKGRCVARGDQQKKYTAKEEVASPTVNTASVFLTPTIEAKERRNTRVHDVPNAFCQADNDVKVIMKLKGKAAEYLILCDPRLYRKFVMIETGIQFCM